MIRRVTTHPAARGAPAGRTIAALPPGTPVEGGMRIVYFMPDGVTVGMVPADAMVTADGAPVYATGPAHWGQLVGAGTP